MKLFEIDLSMDVAAAIVGIPTLVVFFLQFLSQNKVSKRIADLQYCKMVEDKLLAIIYKFAMRETPHSVPTIDYYKFHFLRGYILPNRSDLQNQPDPFSQLLTHNFSEESKREFSDTYRSLLKGISTAEIVKYYQDSQFQKLYDHFQG